MIELLKDKDFRKNLLIAIGIIVLLILEFAGLCHCYPWQWLNAIAWVLAYVSVFGYVIFMLALLISC